MLIKNIKSNNYHYLIKLTKSFYIILSIYRELSIFFYCLYKITKIRKLLTNNENLNKLIT